MDIIVRDAELNDAERIAAILNATIATGLYTSFDTPFSVDAERDYIRRFPSSGIFHVAVRRSDGEVVGFQSLERSTPYTHACDHVGQMGTFVDLGLRGQGIGSQLFVATLAAAPRKLYEKAWAFIRADNAPALDIYKKHGFHVVGIAERHVKRGDQYFDDIIVERFL
jgi:L-amino acid N-acyltransferase YncA